MYKDHHGFDASICILIGQCVWQIFAKYPYEGTRVVDPYGTGETCPPNIYEGGRRFG